MRHRSWLRPPQLDALVAEVLENQRAEGVVLTADEIMEVRRRLADQHLTNTTWSPSWDCLARIALLLQRPDLLRTGRETELFAMSVAISAGVDPALAWETIIEAHAAGRRGLLCAAREIINHGPPHAERSDVARFRLLVLGIAVARRERFAERITELLRATRPLNRQPTQ